MSTSALPTTREAASSDSVVPRAASAPAASRSRPTDAGPWYRREAWLAVTLAAFVPVSVGFFTPQSVHVPLLALAALLVIVGVGLLVRRGATR